ncbi:MAG: hypothetical protein IPJ37_04225 [Bacteroidales bacterium]|nr:hypothetical protein [Bacteroidales bacterium]
MLNAFLWGLLATSSLILGGIIALRYSFGNKILGIIMAFGAGTLISAVSYELIFDSLKLAKGTGFPGFGFFSGALVFFFSDKLIEKLGARSHMDIGASHESSLAIPMLLGIILDGIPESIVIGLGIFEGGKISMVMLGSLYFQSSGSYCRHHRHESRRMEKQQDNNAMGIHFTGMCSLNDCRLQSLQLRIRSLAVIYQGFCRWSYNDGPCQLNDT